VGAGGIRLMPSPMAEPFEIVQRIEGDDRFVISFFPTASEIRPVTRRASFVNTSVIIIDNNDQVLTPALNYLSPEQRTQVEFLTEHFLDNRRLFENNQMQRVSGSSGTFYLMADSIFFPDGNMSTLMYTDVTPAMDFTNSMNQILGALLVISGLFSLVTSIVMSTRFKRAIVRLCNHAEKIGRGNFNARAGEFKDAEFTRLSNSMRDMAEMLQNYENKQKQFFQNASHELRTPLMSIQGYAVGINRDVFSKEEATNIILSESEKMARLVDELLYISRMDSIKEVKKEEVNLSNLLQDCCERIKPTEKQINLTTQKLSIYTDEEKLERAIINILSNAIRHAKSTITVTLTSEAQNVIITISDDGEGIAPEALAHIFERFYKGENGNHGLGLAISKDIIKSLGGKITAKNNNGAVFTITFYTTVPI
ncbi:MAG: HAMP domain-containing histidine kinase, partial [Defluviitaleaceae bacterium]|nr:HAMP domain-containing histidine kinase [Defluviitaleaceae bacterium]